MGASGSLQIQDQLFYLARDTQRVGRVGIKEELKLNMA